MLAQEGDHRAMNNESEIQLMQQHAQVVNADQSFSKLWFSKCHRHLRLCPGLRLTGTDSASCIGLQPAPALRVSMLKFGLSIARPLGEVYWGGALHGDSFYHLQGN